MSDREDVLARLLTVLKTVEGVDEATRNEEHTSGDDKVRVLLLDGQEIASEDDPPRARSGNLEPRRVIMQPEIYVLLAANSESVGTLLNTFRSRVVSKVMTDAPLRALCWPRGGIRYEGMETDLASGRLAEGEARIDLSFEYVLQPSEL